MNTLIDNLVQKNSDKYKYKNSILYVKKLAWIPLLKNNNEYIEIYFDVRLYKEILKIIPKITSEFYLISPILSTNSKIDDITKHKVNINNYLSNYAFHQFYYGFKKIEFDILSNLISYCRKFNSVHLIKDIYNDIIKEMDRKLYDYHRNTHYSLHDENIILDFKKIYREIILLDILI